MDGRKWCGLKSKGDKPNSFLDQSESEERITGVPLEIRKDVEFRVERDIVTRDLDSDLNTPRQIGSNHLGYTLVGKARPLLALARAQLETKM